MIPEQEQPSDEFAVGYDPSPSAPGYSSKKAALRSSERSGEMEKGATDNYENWAMLSGRDADFRPPIVAAIKKAIKDRDKKISDELGESAEMADWVADELTEAAIATIQPVTNTLLDPDMPAQQLRLHMGEITAEEMRVARATIRWANTRQMQPMPQMSEDEFIEIAIGISVAEGKDALLAPVTLRYN